MIKFNWAVLNRYTKSDHEKVFGFFEQITNNRRLSQYATNILNSKSKRDSFLLNNREFVNNSLNGSLYERYNYIYLASKRNLADYVYKGILWLPIELCDIVIENNRLLETIDDKIYFKYEEK